MTDTPKPSPEPTPAHGIVAEIETELHKMESIAEDDYQWIKAKLAELRAHL